MKAVQIQTVETRAALDRQRLIVGAEPSDEVQDIGIAPHPGGESTKVPQRLHRVPVASGTTSVLINPIRVGPIRLDGDRRETLFRNQAFRDDGALSIELMRSMRGFA